MTFLYSVFTEPSLSFSHNPGSMFMCDTTVNEYFDVHKPQHGDEQPRLITLTDQPYLASVSSASAVLKVEKLAKMVCESPNKADGPADSLQVANDFLKIAVRLSHAPSVVIALLHEKESFFSETSTLDCIQGAMHLIKGLQALDKKITIVTQHSTQRHVLQDSLIASAAQGQISNDGVCVVEWDASCDMKEKLYRGEINHRLDTIIALQMTTKTESNEAKGGLVDRFFQQGM